MKVKGQCVRILRRIPALLVRWAFRALTRRLLTTSPRRQLTTSPRRQWPATEVCSCGTVLRQGCRWVRRKVIPGGCLACVQEAIELEAEERAEERRRWEPCPKNIRPPSPEYTNSSSVATASSVTWRWA